MKIVNYSCYTTTRKFLFIIFISTFTIRKSNFLLDWFFPMFWPFSKWKYFLYVENVMINLRFWSVLTETDIFLKRDEISREGTNTYLWINVSHFWIGEMRAFDVNCQNISSPCNLKIFPFVNAFTQFSKRKLNSYILDIFCAMKENICYIFKNYHH